MLFTLLLMTLVTQPFFDGSSVATATRTNGFFQNPAGFGINPGVELSYQRNFTAGQSFGIALTNIGFAGQFKPDTTSYQIATGIRLAKSFALGHSFSFGTTTTHTLGALCRPSRYLSCGITSQVKRSPLIRAGIGLRPFTDRLTVFFDATYRDSLGDFFYGAGFEPLNGILVSFAGSSQNQFRFGLELSLGNLKIGSSADTKFNDPTVGVVLSGKPYPTFLPPRKRLVEVTLEGDYAEDQEQSLLFGISLRRQPAFYNLIHRLDQLKERNDCRGVLLTLKNFNLGLAQTEELRKVLSDLKTSGKTIIAYAYGYEGLISYYLASIADQVILVPLGDVAIPGIWMASPYLKGTLDKLGIVADVEHIGTYKSAVEPFTRTDMSDADREQRSLILDDLYSPMVDAIGQARNIPRDSLEQLINQTGFFNATDALTNRLIDTVAFTQQLNEVMKARTGKNLSRQPLGIFLKSDEVKRSWRDEKPKIALVIAEGSIVVGKSGNDPIPLIGQGKYIGSETVAEQLKKVRDDNRIKAVVFRINSGGGSALASDIITEAVKQMKEKKPVVVSLGDVAASGGYYIACYGDRIFADRATITGSIGILSVKLVTRGLFEKLGITWDWIKKGEHADAFSDLRPFSETERELVRRELRHGYDQFLLRVAEGRRKTIAAVDSIGQGRVWSGTRAAELGLVDQVGGLLDAIATAKELAGLQNKEVAVDIYPAPESRFQFQLGVTLPSRLAVEHCKLLEMLREPKLYLMPAEIKIGD